jgi:flagellar biosynthesis GTPase FlhF
VDEKAEQELLDANKKRRKLTPSRKKLENPESASPRPVLRKDGVKQGRAPLSPAAERMRKSRARQSDKKKDKVKAKDTTARRETRQKRTAEEKAEDNHNRQKARGTRSSKEKREQKKRRRDAWAGRDPKKKEAHNAKRKKDREKRTPEQVEAENAKAKESMRGLTQARKGIVLDLAGSFETTKLWEVPGIDYVFDDFQDNPDSSTLLFYGDNGTWRDREPKMLIAWMRLFRKLISTMIDIGGDANTDCAKQKLGGLTKLCRESIEDEVTLLRVVYEHIKKDDWQSIFAFRDKEAIDNLEFAALDWLVTKGLDCGQECKALREKR